MLSFIEALERARKEVNFNSSPGIDGIEPRTYRDERSVKDKAIWTDSEVDRIMRLIKGGYNPSKLKRVQIPKPDGRMRTIGIPITQDKVVSSALNQMIAPILNSTLHVNAKGSTKGFGCQHSLRLASQARKENRFAVILDLEKCFDNVNHDILMSKISNRINDREVVKLISRFMRVNGQMGIPQGNPMCPTLLNLYLQEFDYWITQAGFTFVRYLDDVIIFGNEKQDLIELKKLLGALLEDRLRRTVNDQKSNLVEEEPCPFLGLLVKADGRIIAERECTIARAQQIFEAVNERPDDFFAIEGPEPFHQIKQIVKSKFQYLLFAENKADLFEVLADLESRLGHLFVSYSKAYDYCKHFDPDTSFYDDRLWQPSHFLDCYPVMDVRSWGKNADM